ncbi:AGAP000533-PA-like protein [Anopheles sinensis]|uniref:AGAP000533-PA-like protein n=1 Tax=Anopheles sinensis TaxID=74873 RepID=A0A084WPI6_ANOSI|nr:AGAP000533-PA-like protein [Anopheles sinensis]
MRCAFGGSSGAAAAPQQHQSTRIAMNPTSLYITTSRLVFQGNIVEELPDLNRLLPYLRKSLSCVVCCKLLVDPHSPSAAGCQHHVCRVCVGKRKKLKPACRFCKDLFLYRENTQLRLILQCYKGICSYIRSRPIYEEIRNCASVQAEGGATGNVGRGRAPGRSNGTPGSLMDLIEEGATFQDDFKCNSGLTKSAYSILPCIYPAPSLNALSTSVGGAIPPALLPVVPPISAVATAPSNKGSPSTQAQLVPSVAGPSARKTAKTYKQPSAAAPPKAANEQPSELTQSLPAQPTTELKNNRALRTGAEKPPKPATQKRKQQQQQPNPTASKQMKAGEHLPESEKMAKPPQQEKQPVPVLEQPKEAVQPKQQKQAKQPKEAKETKRRKAEQAPQKRAKQQPEPPESLPQQSKGKVGTNKKSKTVGEPRSQPISLPTPPQQNQVQVQPNETQQQLLECKPDPELIKPHPPVQKEQQSLYGTLYRHAASFMPIPRGAPRCLARPSPPCRRYRIVKNTCTPTTPRIVNITTPQEIKFQPAPIKTVSSGSTMYSVVYAESGNKVTIKRKPDPVSVAKGATSAKMPSKVVNIGAVSPRVPVSGTALAMTTIPAPASIASAGAAETLIAPTD